MDKKTKNLLSIILSIIVVFFMKNKFSISGNTVTFVIIFLTCFVFLKKTIETEHKQKFIVSITIAILFSAIEIICSSINSDYTLNHVLDRFQIVNFLGYTILLWSSISFIYYCIENKKIDNYKEKRIFKLLFDSKYSFFINIVLIFLAWMPYYLTYYPGLLTADSCAQIMQAIGMKELTNHHPIVHTGIISIFINFGKNIIGNINIGVGLYILFQMIAMSIMFSIILMFINKNNKNNVVKLICLLYYMLYPVHALFSVIMWKDILFSGIIPIYIIINMELLNNKNEFFSKKKNVINYIIVSLLVMFLRNNGFHIVILTLPFIIIALRKQWKKAIIIVGTIIIMYILIKSAIFNLFNVKDGSVGEMLSIPLQQIARVKKYHKEEMDEESIKQINEFFICNNIEEKYNPVLSDPVKAELNNEFFNNNKIKFLKLWLKLLRTYFKDYVESFISNSYGYYYPEATHWVANRTVEENNLGIVQTPLVKGKIISKIDSYIEKRDIPLISMFFSIGMAFWIIIISFGYELIKRNYQVIIPYYIILLLWLTIVASPVFCEYRYAYPMFTSLPIYVVLSLKKRNVVLKENISKKGIVENE